MLRRIKANISLLFLCFSYLFTIFALTGCNDIVEKSSENQTFSEIQSSENYKTECLETNVCPRIGDRLEINSDGKLTKYIYCNDPDCAASYYIWEDSRFVKDTSSDNQSKLSNSMKFNFTVLVQKGNTLVFSQTEKPNKYNIDITATDKTTDGKVLAEGSQKGVYIFEKSKITFFDPKKGTKEILPISWDTVSAKLYREFFDQLKIFIDKDENIFLAFHSPEKINSLVNSDSMYGAYDDKASNEKSDFEDETDDENSSYKLIRIVKKSQ